MCSCCTNPAKWHISYQRGAAVSQQYFCGPHAAELNRHLRPLTNPEISQWMQQPVVRGTA